MRYLRRLLVLSALLLSAQSAQAQIFTDTMTGTAGADLPSVTASDGHSWGQNTAFGASNFVYDNANRAMVANAFGAALNYGSVTPPSADYYTECVFYVLTSNLEQYPSCLVRASTSAYTYYGVLYDTLNGKWVLEEKNASVSGDCAANFTQALSNNTAYTVRITAIGTSITGTINGVLRLSCVDSTISAAGVPGIASYNPAAATDTTHIHIESISSAAAGSNSPNGGMLLGVGR